MAEPKQGYLGAFLLNLVVVEHIKSEILVLDSSKHSSTRAVVLVLFLL